MPKRKVSNTEPRPRPSTTETQPTSSNNGESAHPGRFQTDLVDKRENGSSANGTHGNGGETESAASAVAAKVRELVRLAQDQGYLTYDDINEALGESAISPDQLDEIYVQLRNLDVEIVDQPEMDTTKA